MRRVSEWSTCDVGKWLQDNGFRSYMPLLCDTHCIDGKALLTLTEDDFTDAPLHIVVNEDIRRLIAAISQLKKENRLCEPWYQEYNQQRSQEKHVHSNGSLPAPSESERSIQRSRSIGGVHLDYLKCIGCLIFMATVFMIVSFVLVLANDDLPDAEPLDDILLNHIPFIPWAFDLCEVFSTIIMAILIVVIVLHKHRLIIVRRLSFLIGMAFLLRCFTIYMTALPVPSPNLICLPERNSTLLEVSERALNIWLGFGLSIQGVKTCGDYMYSGHTLILTIPTLFITEYSPKHFHWLHRTSWSLSLAGIFFLFIAHEHYSMDIFIAFLVALYLYNIYHMHANRYVLPKSGWHRLDLWLPFMTFLENDVDGPVPNEYEWPLPWPAALKRLVGDSTVASMARSPMVQI